MTANQPLERAIAQIDELLAPVDARLAAQYPGDRPGHQPIHSVYVPADRAHAGTVREWGEIATGLLAEHAAVLDGRIPAELVERNLQTGPIQDLRIDFEDGYAPASDAACVGSARSLSLQPSRRSCSARAS